MTTPADQIIGLYRRHATAWTTARKATARGPRLIEHLWLEAFTALLPPGATVLDIGCGSGLPVARHLLGQGLIVTGVDSAPEMIALFRQNLPDQLAHVADMRSLALEQRFNGLIAWDSFFHLSPDHQRRMFPIFREHAAPGTALMFTSGPASGEVVGTLEDDPLYHASLDGDEYRSLLRNNGFTVVRHIVEDPDCGGHTVWLSQFQ